MKKCNKIAALALMALVSSAEAEVIAFGFTGQVTFAGPSIFGLNPAVGDAVTGSFAYDSDLPDQTPQFSFLGLYAQLPPYRLIVSIGGSSAWSGTVEGIRVFNDAGGNAEDGLDVASQPAVVNGIQTSDVVLGISFFSTSTGALPDDHLPSALDLADFDVERIGGLNSGSDNTIYVQFSIDSITRLDAPPPDPGPGILVPEPSALQLLVIGLLAFTLAARSRWRLLSFKRPADRRGRENSRH